MLGCAWGFEQRELLMEYYEGVSGSRMHAAYFRLAAFIRTARRHARFDDAWIKRSTRS